MEPGSREGLVNRDAAIEAGARALRSAMYPDVAERLDPLPVSPNWLHIAAAVIDAATPHLVGEPIGYGYTADGWATVQRTDTLAAARLVALVHEWRYAVALIRVEDQP